MEQVAKMEKICAENGIGNGSLLILSAYTLKSIVYIRQEKVDEAKDLLEKTYEGYLGELNNDKLHPFLEQTLN